MSEKIEILGKTIGRIYVKKCLGGKPIRYLCVCECGCEFTATSQQIRGQKRDCGCGCVSGIRRKKFEAGDVYKGSRVIDVLKKYEQTSYRFVCAGCGNECERVHAVFLKHPLCPKCLYDQNKEEKIKALKEEYEGKIVNGIKIISVVRFDQDHTGHSLIVKAMCPVCQNTFETYLARIKQGIKSCADCARKNLDTGREVVLSMCVEGTSVTSISGTRRLNKNSSTGHTGVSVDRKSGRYRAYINFCRKQYYLGLYDRIEDAVEARKTAEKNIYGDFLDWYAKEYPEDWKRMEKKRKA